MEKAPAFYVCSRTGSNTSFSVAEGCLGTTEAAKGQCDKEHTRLLSVGLGVKRDRLGHEQSWRSYCYQEASGERR